VRLAQISERLRAENADFCLLTEYRTKPGASLRQEFSDYHLAETTPPLNQNGILALAKTPLQSHEIHRRSQPRSSHRWLALHMPDIDLLALGVHIPNQNERWNKDEFWKKVGSFAKKHRRDRAIILGDLNTGLDADTENERFLHSPQFQNLLDLGWVDCYRVVHGDRREYSWFSPQRQNGYRIDHIFLSAALAPRIVGARYDHDVRAAKLSDHSLLTVVLSE